jgi:carboxyl-terminal processing protease
VIRLVFLMCLILTAPAHAQGQGGQGFDAGLLANVQIEAIDFMVPRTLEAVSAGTLALWSLGGLTAIDPDLMALAEEKELRLTRRGRPIFSVPLPADRATDWGRAIAGAAVAAYNASPVVRKAGQVIVTKALMDEMLAHLDPYSRYLPPIEAVGDRDRRAGRAGLGVELYQKGHAVAVKGVMIGSPAALAGIVPGDVIQRIDGIGTNGRDHNAVDALLSGPEGTDVRVDWLSRDGMDRWATMRRTMIPPETVFPRQAGEVSIIQITGFSQTTDQQVAQVVRDARKGGRTVSGIILDLRGNRGGVLRAAVGTANLFLPPGTVVRSSGRAEGTNKVWLSEGPDLVEGTPMVVLVDGGTASAAEVLAAALADRGRAVVIGSLTFGKGLVQTIDTLPDGGELFLTWSRLLAPLGWPIQSLGVMPQVCTSLGAEETRRQIASLATGVRLTDAALLAHREARAPLTPDQIVAIRARCPASDPRASDIEVAEGLIDNPTSYAAALLPPISE